MTSSPWNRRKLALMAAVLTVAAAFLSIALASPKPFSNAALGNEWQCVTTAFVVTTCTRVRDPVPMAQTWHGGPLRPRGDRAA
jgi:hypothetical protein